MSQDIRATAVGNVLVKSKESVDFSTERVGTSIVIGRVYAYINDLPKGCKGHLYFTHRFVLDVPSYQDKVLVEALTGKDRGLWFVCSVSNFALRYREATEEEYNAKVTRKTYRE